MSCDSISTRTDSRERLPALRLLTRPRDDIAATAARVLPAVVAAFPAARCMLEPCRSQIGSGALPVDLLDSCAITLADGREDALAAKLRALPRPVIGRIGSGRVWLDCRCLEPDEEAAFAANLA